jgi:hypothetical protein
MRGIILAGITCALPNAAWADPPQAGQLLITSSAMICDTKEQVMELYFATKTDGGKDIIPKYLEYNGLLDEAGEPTCNRQPVLGSPVKSVEDLGMSEYSGNGVHGWLIEITGQDGASAWVLYGEDAKKAGQPETET